MFGINLNAVSLLSTVALGPAGGIGVQLAQQVFASMGQQLLQGFGQGLNLPQETISLAQDTFSGAGVGASIEGHASLQDSVAAAGAKAGLSPAEIGDQQRQVSDFVNNTIKQAQESDEYNEVKASGKGGGWLMAMAKALGAQLDQLGDEMTDMASRITKDTPGLSAEFGVVTQQFSMLMNATTNAIKTVGEAMGKAASRN